jgi:hypothetical protein
MVVGRSVVPRCSVVDRRWRLSIGGTDIGEHDPMTLMNRIGTVTEPVLESALHWLAWGLENGPVHREPPSVVAAAYALGIDRRELQ